MTTESKEKARNSRGFREYGTVTTSYGTAKVTESSAAGKGAHVWVFFDATGMHMSVEQAGQLIALLQTFVKEAEAGELIEPATPMND
jgi:hypothetical protein